MGKASIHGFVESLRELVSNGTYTHSAMAFNGPIPISGSDIPGGRSLNIEVA